MTPQPLSIRRAALLVVLFSALTPVWVALMLLPVVPAQAAGVVTNCSSPTDFYGKMGGGGLVTFNCPGPGPKVITVSGGTGIIPATNTTIDGSNNGNPIILSGGNTNRLFDQWTSGGTLTLKHLTLRDGNSGGAPGGCLLNEGARVVLIDVTVTHCTAGPGVPGGGLFSFTGTLTLMDSRVISNTAPGGAGIAAGGWLTMINTIVSDNYANGRWPYGTGGGLLVTGTLYASNSQILDNYAFDSGGGIEAFEGGAGILDGVTIGGNTVENLCAGMSAGKALTLTNSTVSNNRTLDGYNGLAGGMCLDGDANLTNVTISGNSAGVAGGAYHNGSGGGSVTLRNVRFYDNQAAQFGGAIENESGRIDAYDTLFSGNKAPAGSGGAIHNYLGDFILNNVTLSGNSASSSGGAISNSAYLVIFGGHLSGNSTNGIGGGIYIAEPYISATLYLFNVTLDGNTARLEGGGIYQDSGTAQMFNTTLSGNRAVNGGGLVIRYGRAEMTNSTLSNNSAESGGGINKWVGATVLLTNTLLAYSPLGGNCTGSPITSSKYSLSSDVTCALTGWPQRPDPNGVDPLLTALGNYGGPYPVHMLRLGSPAIDGVIGLDAPTSDERGVSRPQGGGFDIGAVERRPSDSSLAPRLFLPSTIR